MRGARAITSCLLAGVLLVPNRSVTIVSLGTAINPGDPILAAERWF